MEDTGAKQVVFVKEGRDIYGAERATLRLLESIDRARLQPVLLVLEYSNEPSPFLKSVCDTDVPVYVVYSQKELGEKLKTLSDENDAMVSIGYKCHILTWWYLRKLPVSRYAICHGWVATDLKLKLYNWLARRCLKSCTGVMTVSPTIDVPNSNCEVIYNGINVDSLRDASEQSVSYYEAIQGKKFVAYVGRLEKEKGVLELVQAFRETIEGAELVIAGTGSLEGELRRMVNSNGLPVTFLGYQDNPAPLIRHAACLILPSSTEALPLVMLEAMALRTPVLATAVGAVPDVISDNKTGFHLASNSTVDILKGISRVLSVASLDAVVEQSYELVSDTFSDAAVADRVCSFLESE